MSRNDSTVQKSTAWCRDGGPGLVRLLGNAFGKEHVAVRSPHHVQVRCESETHNVWIDSGNFVKFLLADQAGRAQPAHSSRQLLRAITGHHEADSDLTSMEKALELTELIDSAKKAFPLSGLSRAVFVDAGVKDGKARIAVVRISKEADGEHVVAESHPVEATDSNAAERAAIEHAVAQTAHQEVIFCDNRSAVEQAQKKYGERIRWLPREQNKVADRVANVRRKRKRKGKRKRSSSS